MAQPSLFRSTPDPTNALNSTLGFGSNQGSFNKLPPTPAQAMQNAQQGAVTAQGQMALANYQQANAGQVQASLPPVPPNSIPRYMGHGEEGCLNNHTEFGRTPFHSRPINEDQGDPDCAAEHRRPMTPIQPVPLVNGNIRDTLTRGNDKVQMNAPVRIGAVKAKKSGMTALYVIAALIGFVGICLFIYYLLKKRNHPLTHFNHHQVPGPYPSFMAGVRTQVGEAAQSAKRGLGFSSAPGLVDAQSTPSVPSNPMWGDVLTPKK